MHSIRFAMACSALAALLLVACSDSSQPDDSGAVIDSIDLLEVSESGMVTQLVAYDTVVESPFFVPGTRSLRWVEVGDEICSVGPDERVCVPFDVGVDKISFSWDSDGTSVLFNEQWSRFGIDPDIWSFDTASGELTNNTDDGQDSIQAEQADLDVAPFTASDGTTYFFRNQQEGPTTIWTTDPAAGSSETAFDPLDFQVLGGVHQIGTDHYLVSGFVIGNPAQMTLLKLDLAAASVSELAIPTIDSPWVVASGNGAAVITDRDLETLGESTYELINFDDDFATFETTQLAIASDRSVRQLPAIAMSADGRSVVVALRSDVADPLELVGYQLADNGDLDGPIALAPAGFLDQGSADSPRSIQGSDTLQRMIWTDQNELAVVSDGQVLVFELKAGEDG